MRLGRRPGTFVAFADSVSEETVLRVECTTEGRETFSFRLYDCTGVLVIDSEGPVCFPDGHEVLAENGEVLLSVPREAGANICYRLYGPDGCLITCSDGSRTQIFPSLRLTGNNRIVGRPSSFYTTAQRKPA